jgi:predicted oxidoreductase (fatty acid repression mutant protein)
MRIEKKVVEAVCNIEPRTFCRWRKRKGKVVLLELRENDKRIVEFESENLISWFMEQGFEGCAKKISAYKQSRASI